MTRRGGGARDLALLSAFAALTATACGPSNPGSGMPAYTDHYAMRIESDPSPPRARERITYKVVIRDKATGQPVDGGEGLLFGNPRDAQLKAWDSFTPGVQPGTYYANVHFIVAGEWAMGIRFRRDSTHVLEETGWMQTVNNARGEVH